jgi:hypothetical protein
MKTAAALFLSACPLVVVATSACDAVLEIGDLRYDRAGTGAGSGGRGPLRAADWSSSCDALFRFESAPPRLGDDSSGHGHALASIGLPSRDEASAIEGSAAARLGGDDGFESGRAVFASPDGTSLTFGGWFRVTHDDGAVVAAKHDNRDGYMLYRADGRGAGCLVERNDNEFFTVESPADAWPTGRWTHVVCRYDAGARALSVHVDGDELDAWDDGPVMSDSPTRLQLGAGESTGMPFGFVGSIDEFFFVKSALPLPAIQRIFACGVGGERCTCASADPARYEQCNGDCGSLPGCNAPTP